MNIGFIGAGNMARALVEGMLTSGIEISTNSNECVHNPWHKYD